MDSSMEQQREANFAHAMFDSFMFMYSEKESEKKLARQSEGIIREDLRKRPTIGSPKTRFKRDPLTPYISNIGMPTCWPAAKEQNWATATVNAIASSSVQASGI